MELFQRFLHLSFLSSSKLNSDRVLRRSPWVMRVDAVNQAPFGSHRAVPLEVHHEDADQWSNNSL